MTKKALKKQLKKQLKKAVKQAAKNKKAIKLLKRQLSAFEAKSMSYLERLFMSNVDYPIDDFGAIAYVDASYSDTGRFGSIGIVMLTRSGLFSILRFRRIWRTALLPLLIMSCLLQLRQFKWPRKDTSRILLLSMIIVPSLNWLKAIL